MCDSFGPVLEGAEWLRRLVDGMIRCLQDDTLEREVFLALRNAAMADRHLVVPDRLKTALITADSSMSTDSVGSNGRIRLLEYRRDASQAGDCIRTMASKPQRLRGKIDPTSPFHRGSVVYLSLCRLVQEQWRASTDGELRRLACRALSIGPCLRVQQGLSVELLGAGTAGRTGGFP